VEGSLQTGDKNYRIMYFIHKAFYPLLSTFKFIAFCLHPDFYRDFTVTTLLLLLSIPIAVGMNADFVGTEPKEASYTGTDENLKSGFF
jgi:hypothetical protein